jgi:hypothetical protein
MSYDANEVVVSFATSSQQSDLAFQEYMRTEKEKQPSRASILNDPQRKKG